MKKISNKCLDLVKEFEGCRLTAYRDEVGVWTIGYGITNSDFKITKKIIRKGMKISKATAEKWLSKALTKKYLPLVLKYDKQYDFNQNEIDALVSFAYNIGSIKQLTANGTRSRATIASKMLQYNKAGGRVYNGLTRRRKAERALFLAKAAPEKKPVKKKSNETIAKEVLAGKWGSGKERKKKLKAEGYNYAAVQKIVNKLCKK
jgi:GH24 family phage-related lysozyme (muramidase)